jgi:hypothetical protein
MCIPNRVAGILPPEGALGLPAPPQLEIDRTNARIHTKVIYLPVLLRRFSGPLLRVLMIIRSPAGGTAKV